MLNELTEEQKALMPIIAKKWIDLSLHNGKKLKHEDVREGINWMYKKAGYQKPSLIIITPSPYFAQLTASFIKRFGVVDVGRLANVWDNVNDNVRDNVWANVSANVRDNVRDNVWDNVRDNVWDNVTYNVSDNVTYNVSANVSDNVSANVSANVRDNVNDNVNDNVRDNVESSFTDNHSLSYEITYSGLDYDSYWVAFYDYFKEIGVIDDDEFNRYAKLLETGIWNFILFENVAILSETPIRVENTEVDMANNSRRRLHSLTNPSVEFRDGFRIYDIHGVRFNRDEELWRKVSNKQLPAKEILKIKNIEQRQVALKIYGIENIMNELGAKLINEGKKRKIKNWIFNGKEYVENYKTIQNKLYAIKGVSRDSKRVMKVVRYIDASTDREYVKCVPDNIKTADEGVAWSHFLTEETYTKRLNIEA